MLLNNHPNNVVAFLGPEIARHSSVDETVSLKLLKAFYACYKILELHKDVFLGMCVCSKKSTVLASENKRKSILLVFRMDQYDAKLPARCLEIKLLCSVVLGFVVCSRFFFHFIHLTKWFYSIRVLLY